MSGAVTVIMSTAHFITPGDERPRGVWDKCRGVYERMFIPNLELESGKERLSALDFHVANTLLYKNMNSSSTHHYPQVAPSSHCTWPTILCTPSIELVTLLFRVATSSAIVAKGRKRLMKVIKFYAPMKIPLITSQTVVLDFYQPSSN